MEALQEVEPPHNVTESREGNRIGVSLHTSLVVHGCLAFACDQFVTMAMKVLQERPGKHKMLFVLQDTCTKKPWRACKECT
jgi:hypothetical protein